MLLECRNDSLAVFLQPAPVMGQVTRYKDSFTDDLHGIEQLYWARLLVVVRSLFLRESRCSLFEVRAGDGS